MSTEVIFTAGEIEVAQRALDLHPSHSTYWESRDGQDQLGVIQDAGLEPRSTEEHRRQWHSAGMRGARMTDDEREDCRHKAAQRPDFAGQYCVHCGEDL